MVWSKPELIKISPNPVVNGAPCYVGGTPSPDCSNGGRPG